MKFLHNGYLPDNRYAKASDKKKGIGAKERIVAVLLPLKIGSTEDYVGTGKEGIFVTYDRGMTWTAFNEGLGNLAISQLSMSASKTRMLYASTAYGGVWARKILDAGDITGDGVTDLGDVIVTMKLVSGISTEGVSLNGDVNQDGKIGIQEAIFILQTLGGPR